MLYNRASLIIFLFYNIRQCLQAIYFTVLYMAALSENRIEVHIYFGHQIVLIGSQIYCYFN